MSIPACYGIIPARYQSSRFPGKPLAMILGKPMFAHVYERASRCPELSGVALATDDERIEKAAKELGIPVVMTRSDHSSGTDRVLEAALAMDLDDDAVVVNIQGDEPALEPRMLSELLGPFDNPEVCVTTLAARIGPDEAASPDRVKVALAKSGRALYFSRAPIPYAPAGELASYLLHIGLYAFRMETLKRFAELPPTPLEEREKLEQLRLLENGIDIRVVETRHCCHGVDRPEDLDKITHILMEQGT